MLKLSKLAWGTDPFCTLVAAPLVPQILFHLRQPLHKKHTSSSKLLGPKATIVIRSQLHRMTRIFLARHYSVEPAPQTTPGFDSLLISSELLINTFIKSIWKKLLENWNSGKHTKYETIEFNRCKIILSKCSQFLSVYLLFLYLLGCELLTVFKQALVWVQRPGIDWVQISGFATWAKHWNSWVLTSAK